MERYTFGFLFNICGTETMVQTVLLDPVQLRQTRVGCGDSD